MMSMALIYKKMIGCDELLSLLPRAGCMMAKALSVFLMFTQLCLVSRLDRQEVCSVAGQSLEGNLASTKR